MAHQIQDICKVCLLYHGNSKQYKCLICHNYNECIECYKKERDDNHNDCHMMKHMQAAGGMPNIGVKCDRCGTLNFQGQRYKCMMCRDYDLCSSCHEPNHSLNNHPMKQIWQAINIGITCDVCHKSNFIGKRYKCLICADFDACMDCFAQSGRNNSHVSQNHPMQVIEGESNQGIRCDSCQLVDFNGNRYRCMICVDFDLCDWCHERCAPTSHSIFHPMDFVSTEKGAESSIINNNLHGGLSTNMLTLLSSSINSMNLHGNESMGAQRWSSHNNRQNSNGHVSEQRQLSNLSHALDHPMKQIRQAINLVNLGVTCDICRMSNFEGNRYKCLVCADFVSCLDCFRQSGRNNSHVPQNHPMQVIEGELNQGIRCDSCQLVGFNGNRYRCMICMDFDLCGRCHKTSTSQNDNCTFTTSHQSYNWSSVIELKAEPPQPTTASSTTTTSPPTTRVSTTTATTTTTTATEIATTESENDGDEKKQCIICYECPYNTVLVPCGHMWLCFKCATYVKNNGKPCPACRAKVNDIIRVYTPD